LPTTTCASNTRRVVVPQQVVEPSFHEFASEWLAMRAGEGLAERTIEDYRWALTHHLLPWFKAYRLSEIVPVEFDRYKVAKAVEGVLGANQINKTITRLSQILGTAAEYGLVPANAAAGERRRLKGTTPRRAWVESEQLPAVLEAAEPFLAGRGRPLLATLAGAGLRISEALGMERRDVNIVKGTLTIRQAKTDAGVRVVDLTPALRDELAMWLDRSPHKSPTDLVFATQAGKPDNRNNVRRRLLVKAIEAANVKLVELGIEPIGPVSPHGLRRTFASLRCAVGDDVAYTAAQLGHEDAVFSLRTYTHAVKRRERLTGAELEQFERASEWAQWARMGTNVDTEWTQPPGEATSETEKAPHSRAF
jgi:integrase/recombinase XerC